MRDRLQQRGHAPAAQDGGPAVEAGVDVLPVGVAGGGHLVGRPAEERAQGGGAGPGRRGGALEGFEQAEPFVGHGAPNTLPAPLTTAGTPASRASRTRAASRLVRTSTAMCAGRIPPPRGVPSVRRRSIRPGGEEADDVGGQVPGDELPGGAGHGEAVLGEAHVEGGVVAVDDPEAQGGVHGAPSRRGDWLASAACTGR